MTTLPEAADVKLDRTSSADDEAVPGAPGGEPPPTLQELDLHLFGEGRHRRLWERLGSRPMVHQGQEGVAFAVWAPNARAVLLVGDFCGWDRGRGLPLRPLGSSGVWERFVPGLHVGALYKYAIQGPTGEVWLKADPYARWSEAPPRTASRVSPAEDGYAWGDAEWMAARRRRDLRREPLSIYEVHLGSWARVPEEGARHLTYREIAPRLAEHVGKLGFTHVELLPLAEHPFYGSWGYQVTGYYAPTARYGAPDDLRYLIDTLHRAGIGVILDWVPAHFPRDGHGLYRFDGTCLYEHADPRRGEHPDWGTLCFNTGRHEVRNFLLANALYWLESFHVDGLRVDAVASMLYLDYSRQPGEWVPNAYGGREDLDSVAFFHELATWVHEEQPGCALIAEESTAWPGVTAPVEAGGLGFHFKWNMGWMHDTLSFLGRDPVHRRYHLDQLTFAQLYEHSEHFLMPLSHDEVVHGKGSLLGKMAGDRWQQLAGLRLLLAYQTTRPGKQLVFMGTELANPWEWDHDRSLPWHLLDYPEHAGVQRCLMDLNRIYRGHSCLWRCDYPDGGPAGFRWIDCSDRDNVVLSYERRDGERFVVVVLNLTPIPRAGYRIGAPAPGRYRVLIDTDAVTYGGSGWAGAQAPETEPTPTHGRTSSLTLRIPPLAALVLCPE